MEERVLKPMRQSKLLDRYEHETYIAEAMDKEEEKFKDEELLKNPATFSRWMRQHGMER